MHHLSRRKHCSRRHIIWLGPFLFLYRTVTPKWSNIWDISIYRTWWCSMLSSQHHRQQSDDYWEINSEFKTLYFYSSMLQSTSFSKRWTCRQSEMYAAASSGCQSAKVDLEHKASILVSLLAVIMIVTCLPSYLLRVITSICYEYKLHCNLKANLTIIVVLFILENLNFLVNPLL